MLGIVILLVVVATSLWVVIDASNLGAKKGKLGGGFLDMGPVSWLVGCLLLWIICFPCYLVARPRLIAARAAAGSVPAPPAGGVPNGSAVSWPAPPPYPTPTVPAPLASAAAEIERLHELRQSGVISDDQYEALKQRVLE
jgi:hypothetical protein